MTVDVPSLEALLAEARRTLVDEVAPGLSGKDRYKTLMAGNAIAIALREMAALESAGPSGERLDPESLDPLCAAIRRGQEDGSPSLYDRLRDDVAFRCEFSA